VEESLLTQAQSSLPGTTDAPSPPQADTAAADQAPSEATEEQRELEGPALAEAVADAPRTVPPQRYDDHAAPAAKKTAADKGKTTAKKTTARKSPEKGSAETTTAKEAPAKKTAGKKADGPPLHELIKGSAMYTAEEAAAPAAGGDAGQAAEPAEAEKVPAEV
jgi:hypothetical protein